MSADGAADRISLRGRRLPPEYEVREIGLDSGCVRAYDEAEWRDALVVVERGEIELECVRGARLRLGDGAVLWLVGLPLRALAGRRRLAPSIDDSARAESDANAHDRPETWRHGGGRGEMSLEGRMRW